MKKNNKFLALLMLIYLVALCFGSCKNNNKISYTVSVQLYNKSNENYKVRLNYNGKDVNNESPLKVGYELYHVLGKHSIIDSDFETFIKSLKIELLNEDNETVLNQEFSYSDGFIVQIDDRGIPARFQKNEITLFLDIEKDTEGKVLFKITDKDSLDEYAS